MAVGCITLERSGALNTWLSGYLPFALRASSTPTSVSIHWWQPAPGSSWQIQLTGSLDLSFDVQLYDLDLFDTPQEVISQLHSVGKHVICYFSAGSREDWRPDASQFPDSLLGDNLEGWPGEHWLDIRQIQVLDSIMTNRLELAVQKGCDGVDPDNLNGYTNSSGFPLSAQDQIAYNLWIAEQAHARNLAIGLKNDIDQVSVLINSFDWQLNEQCFQYNECDQLLPFIKTGKPVFSIEYQGDPASLCPQANAMNFDTLIKRIDLDAWRMSCR